MSHWGNRSKKPRLDDDWAVNDDLWGQGELTAEEFDYLEIQATQTIQASTSNHTNFNANGTSTQRDDDLKTQQYALEGQIKLLSDSLDKTVRELSTERFNRDQVISENLKEAKEKESRLQKEIEQLKTSLQFKEQETKSVQNKVHLLEQRLKEQFKDNTAAKQTKNSPNKNPNPFLNRFQFNSPTVATKSSSVQTLECGNADAEEHKLRLRAPSGEPSSHDLVSSYVKSRYEPASGNSSQNFCSEAYASLNSGRVTYELWQYFEETLRQHVSFLLNLNYANRGRRIPTFKHISVLTSNYGQTLTGAQPKLEEEIKTHHRTVISCLRNIQVFCPKPGDVMLAKTYNRNKEVLKLVSEPDVESYSCPLFPDEDKADYASGLPGFLVPLITLAKPESYPDCYSYKSDELSHVLLVLVEWSVRKHISLDPLAYVLPIQDLVSGSQGLKCANLTLQLLLGLLPQRRFEALIRHNVNCLFASVADLCQSISHTQGNDYVQVLSSVLAFLGEAIAVLGAGTINEEGCSCSSKLAQGFVVMLWRYHDMCYKNAYSSPSEMEILRQSVLILHLLFTKMKDFVAKKMPVIDQYIVLVCGLYSLCKERQNFKSLSDMVHDLWHFDQDISPDDSEPDDQMVE